MWTGNGRNAAGRNFVTTDAPSLRNRDMPATPAAQAGFSRLPPFSRHSLNSYIRPEFLLIIHFKNYYGDIGIIVVKLIATISAC